VISKENVLLDASLKQMIGNVLNCVYVIVKNVKTIITNQTFLSLNFFSLKANKRLLNDMLYFNECNINLK
jgi:hypothetical protein